MFPSFKIVFFPSTGSTSSCVASGINHGLILTMLPTSEGANGGHCSHRGSSSSLQFLPPKRTLLALLGQAFLQHSSNVCASPGRCFEGDMVAEHVPSAILIVFSANVGCCRSKPQHHRAERKDVSVRSSSLLSLQLARRHIKRASHHCARSRSGGINGLKRPQLAKPKSSKHLDQSGRFCSRPVMITLSGLRSRWSPGLMRRLHAFQHLIEPGDCAEAIRTTRSNSKRKTEAVANHDQIRAFMALAAKSYGRQLFG